MNRGNATFESREFWNSPLEIDKIAQAYGYVLNDAFNTAVKLFYETVVRKATVTQFLGIIGHNFLRDYKPPLTRSPPQN